MAINLESGWSTGLGTPSSGVPANLEGAWAGPVICTPVPIPIPTLAATPALVGNVPTIILSGQ